MAHYLHVISFDVPYPPDYGGVIDVYYRIKALAEAGVKVILHCFEYGRPPRNELAEVADEMHLYARKKPLSSLPLRKPYITLSRRSKDLLSRLLEDDHPILFEGLHCCYYLDHPSLKDRKKLVRMHNIEWQYYQQLAAQEGDLVKKQYLHLEAKALRKYEIVLWDADHILAISPKDEQYLADKYVGVHYLPAFHPYTQVTCLLGKGDYCLYHAKLSVAENHQAAMYLIREVFAEMSIPLIIAGSDPLPELIHELNQHEHIMLRHNPGAGEMEALMREAHVHILPTFQDTGIKLKLLNALFSGRFILVNPPMVKGTGLEGAVAIAETPRDFRVLTLRLFRRDFSQGEIDQRKKLLTERFSNRKGAELLVGLLGG